MTTTSKERLHRKEKKRDRRKARKKAMTPGQWQGHNDREAQKVIEGAALLAQFLEPIVESSKQREIAASVVED